MRASVFLVFLAMIGCEQQAPIQARSAPPDPSQFYTVQATKTAAKVGEPVKAGFEIKPASGWKINEEYPWKFEVEPGQNLQVAATTINKEQVQLSQAVAKVPVEVTATAAGTYDLKAKGRLSICNPDACHNFQNQEIVFQVEAQP
jgi:hypothetical protein